MAVDVQIIDLRRSYIPIDPQAFPVTELDTTQEDQPEGRTPVIPYDGYNFMPTPQGYASFFGINSKLDIDPLDIDSQTITIAAVAATYTVIPDETVMQAQARVFVIVQANGFPAVDTLAELYALFGVANEAALFALVSVDNWYDFTNYLSNSLAGPVIYVRTIAIPGQDAITYDIPGGLYVDDLFMIQTDELDNVLVALRSDGIWVKSATTTGAWNNIVALVIPEDGVHKKYTKCVIDNALYIYRQGEAGIFKADAANSYIPEIFVPSFLNMAGQLGIFKAGGRLGFWDSENSTAWSALGDTADCTPSIKTLAGNTIFQDIVGKIVTVRAAGTGFIIYCTKSIVIVTRDTSSPSLFKGHALYNDNGISYSSECCAADPDIQQFAMTTKGLVEITASATPDGSTSFGAKFIEPEISTYLREKRLPIKLQVLGGRYLTMHFLDPSYITSKIYFDSEEVPSYTYEWKKAAKTINDINDNNTSKICQGLAIAMEKHDQVNLYNTFGYTGYSQAGAGKVPIWEDHLSTVIPFADLTVYKDSGDLGPGHGNVDYFDDTGFTLGGISLLDGGTAYFIPTKSPTATNTKVDDNTQDFYLKQKMLWFWEQFFIEDWQTAIKNKQHGNHSSTAVSYGPQLTPLVAGTLGSVHRLGPYIDLSWHSGSDEDYAIYDKSAKLQRSLTKQIVVVVRESRDISGITGGILGWAYLTGASFTSFDANYASYAAMVAGVPTDIAAEQAAVAAALLSNFGSTLGAWTAQVVAGVQTPGYVISGTTGFCWSYLNHEINTGPNPGRNGNPITVQIFYGATGGVPVGYTTGERYAGTYDAIQSFSVPQFESINIPTCTVKNIGFTKIIGHGHYNGATFIQDDSTPEATDYVDFCDTDPPKKGPSSVFFNGNQIPDPFNGGKICGKGTGTVSIDGEDFPFTSRNLTIPSGDILLQFGSGEPFYPTYVGAHVFDLQYKKWGKLAQNFKLLLDIYPINSAAGDGVIPYDSYLPRAGMLGDDGLVYIFDQFPLDSRIVYGKIGYYRKGFTDSEEIRFTHRSAFSGQMLLECSIDGRNIEPSLSFMAAYTDAVDVVVPWGTSARWYNIIIQGGYDLKGLEFRGHKTARR